MQEVRVQDTLLRADPRGDAERSLVISILLNFALQSRSFEFAIFIFTNLIGTMGYAELNLCCDNAFLVITVAIH